MIGRRNLLAVFTASLTMLGLVLSQVGDLKAAPPTPTSYICFPTCAADDSRMLSLSAAGQGLSSDGTMQFALHAAPGTATLALGIFDSDARGATPAYWDDGGVNHSSPTQKYEVFADPLNDGTGTTIVAGFIGAFPFLTDLAGTPLAGSLTGDNAWYDMAITNGPSALGTDGAYHYRLKITSTGLTPQGTASVGGNQFKVRTDGTLGLTPTPFAFIAALHNASDIATVYPNSGGLTTGSQVGGKYDGRWEFAFFVPTGAVGSLAVWDGDMDYGNKDCNKPQDTDDPDTSYTTTPNTLPFPASSSSLEGVATGGVLCLGGAVGQRATANPADDTYSALDVAGVGKDTAFMRVKYPSTSFGLDVSGQPYQNVVYSMRDLAGTTYRNTNPSGQNEWEQFRIDTNLSTPADFHPASIRSGTWRVRLDGQDSGNLSNWYYTYNLLGLTGGGDPAPEDAFCSLRGVVFADTNGNAFRDVGEASFPNATLTVVDSSNEIYATTTTDADGAYEVRVPAGTWHVTVDGTNFTTLLAGLSATTAGGNTSLDLTVGAPVYSSTHDFGYSTNRPPTAVNDVVTSACTTPITISVLSNDSDPDSDPLTVEAIVAAPSNGTAVINGDGTVTYTSSAPCPASVTFTYRINDGKGGTSTAVVTVNIPSPPVARDDSYTVVQDNVLTVNALNGIIESNDTDPDNEALIVSYVTNGPSHGLLALQLDGSFVYTPNPGFTGTDSFQYTVDDTTPLTSNVATVTITVNPKRTMTVTATGGTFPYDGSGHGGVCTFSDGLTGRVTYENLVVTSLPVHANTYLMTCLFDGNAEFEPALARATITITPLAATITAGGGTKVYGTGDPALSAIATVGFINGDEAGLNLTQARATGEDVGSYPTSATLLGNTTNLENYAINYVGGNFSITPATPTATATGGTFVYDGNPHDGTCTISGGLTGTLTYTSGGTTAPTAIGTYTVNCDYEGDNNHNPAHATSTITITPKAATITAGGGTKVYGTSDPALTAMSNSGFSVADAAGITFAQSRAAGENVGSYVVTPTATGGNVGNYSVAPFTGTFTITPAQPTATATGGVFVYDGNQHPGTCTISDGLVGSLTYAPGGTTAPKNVGTYSVLCSYPGDLNHKPASDSSSITITRKTASVTAGIGTKTYGSADPALSATLSSGFLPADLVGLTLNSTRAAGENVGTYVTTPTVTGVGAANYDITYNPRTFTITPKAATVTAGSGTKVYGTPDPALTTSASGISAADLVGATLTTTRTAGQTVGSYVTTATATGGGTGNYTLTILPGTFTITPKPLSVVANNKTKTQGSANPTLDGTLTGVVAGDSITATYSTTAVTASPVGTYPITPALVASAATLSNYTVTITNGTLTVTAAGPVCTVEVRNDAYEANKNQQLSIVAKGILRNDVDPYGRGLQVATVNGAASKVGVTTATAHGTVKVMADGSFVYKPATNYTGTDTFTYQAKSSYNGQVSANTATVTITIKAHYDGDGCDHDRDRGYHRDGDRCDHDKANPRHYSGDGCDHDRRRNGHHSGDRCTHDNDSRRASSSRHYEGDSCDHDRNRNGHRDGDNCSHDAQTNHHNDGDNCDHDRGINGHRDGDDCSHDREGHDHRDGDGCEHDRGVGGHHDGDHCEHDSHHDDDNDGVTGCAVSGGSSHHHSDDESDDEHHSGDGCDHDRNRNGHRANDGCDHDRRTKHYDGDRCDHDRNRSGHRDGDRCDHDRATRNRD